MIGKEESYDVVVIGAGPAGLTAALYAGRALLSTLVVEMGLPGGQLNETDLIENWPGFEETVSAPELMQSLRKQAERFGAEFAQDEVVRIETGDPLHRVVTPRASFETRTIVVSPGSRPKELSAEGAARLKGKGVSYCATCDGFFFQGKEIVEIGAGDSGLTEALFLTRFVESISIVVRHPEADPKAFRASAILQKRALDHPKIRFLWDCVVDEVLGDDHVTGVRLRNLDTMETSLLETNGVFVNIGHDPQTEFLRGTVELDEAGYVVTDQRLHTSVPGIFAAGDARVFAHLYAQGVVAAGEGAIAAIEAQKYVSG
ncbi:MAG: FAD-dependent oxidoreductase [Candidatus Bipolaricaulia bacterium]